MARKQPPESVQNKPRDQAQKDTASREDAERRCDFIALYGWGWWKQVIADVEARTAGNTAREDN